ncbi:hypothetical protein ACI790_17220 [Blastococcus sp. SYSU DS0539]
MRGIGRLARESGLTVSALRFYDGAAPAVVDAVLQAHLTRLEDGLADARRELRHARSLLAPESLMTSIRTTTAALLDAAGGVRFAAGTDAALPMLTGVLLDVADDAVRLVASDRYRLAVRTLAADVDGPPVSALLPIALVDELLGTTASGPATVRVQGNDVTVELAGRTLQGRRVDADFPDYRRILRGAGAAQVEIDVARFRAELAAAPTRTVRRTEDGVEETAAVLGVGGVEVGVNREFLLEALDAEHAGQLVLDLDGPIAPLVLRGAGRDGDVSMLMPIRLD